MFIFPSKHTEFIQLCTKEYFKIHTCIYPIALCFIMYRYNYYHILKLRIFDFPIKNIAPNLKGGNEIKRENFFKKNSEM